MKSLVKALMFKMCRLLAASSATISGTRWLAMAFLFQLPRVFSSMPLPRFGQQQSIDYIKRKMFCVPMMVTDV